MTRTAPSQRLTIDLAALARNYRTLAQDSGAARCGAAVKANAYGLGLAPVVHALLAAGCRSFFAASLAEALAVREIAPDAEIVVLHGVSGADVAETLAARLLPVINTPAQAQAWRLAGAPCALMVDTGINRLGLGLDQLDAAESLTVDLLMSHLACADTPAHPLNERQRAAFANLSLPARRRSFANSCGIALGAAYHFDLTRPGIGLYGGVAGSAPVVTAEAQVLQRRRLNAGETVGYGASWTAAADTDVATLGLGYADGYLRGFSGTGTAYWQGLPLPVIGRVSMDLVTLDASAAPDLKPGDWVELIGPHIPLSAASRASGLSEYELLTCLGARYERRYTE